MDERQETQFDRYAETYDEGLKDLLGVFGNESEKFAEYKIQLLRCVIPPKENGYKILDFGCGIGRSLSYLKKYYCKEDVEFFGCDVSEESLKIAQENVPFARFFLNTTYQEIERFGMTYDIVMLACVLHHIDPLERQQWIQAIIKNLNPGGKIAVFEHNVINPFTKKIVLDPKNKVDDIEWMLSISDIEKLLLCNKSMKRLWKGYVLFSPIRLPFMTSFERCLKWLPLGAQECVIVEKC